MEKEETHEKTAEESYISFMIPATEKDHVKKMYQTAKKELEELNYNIDSDISVLRETATKNGIINLAERYIGQL